ncbi:sulfite exporter TauE/SafE family protein [Vallitalea okinawensis]|uniref:sulfite exporter TauE/SafE family protein n=1 Tax=Vallitalea okinawensis TaxID=2078660 RepID=UPI000CFCEE4F|nr:sulfite exporter TauE/SafE family protein [Vallitalea okinawensis]
MLMNLIIAIIAGWGAGVVTGLVGASAAVIITPMLVTFAGFDPFIAIGIALATDVFASGISAYTYSKHGNIEVKKGMYLAIFAFIFAIVGSYLSTFIESSSLGNTSALITLLMGIRFLRKPLNESVAKMKESNKFKFFQERPVFSSIFFGSIIGIICGFVGAGGGIMILLILSLILGYEMKTAIGTSVLIMIFTAFAGAVAHFAIPYEAVGMDTTTQLMYTAVCVVTGLIGAKMAAKFANFASEEKLNKVVGVTLTILGAVMVIQKWI